MSKKKYLFITHDTSIYGASRSLQTLLKNINVEYDLVIQKKLRSSNNIDDIKTFFGGNASNIYEFYLPFEECFIGRNKNKKFVNKIFDYVKSIFYKLNKHKIYRLIDKNNYTAIHLNSIVLYPLIDNKSPFFIHIRELFDGVTKNNLMQFLQKAEGIIFIDNEVAKPFIENITEKSLILNNPFDMRNMQKYPLNSDKNLTIFSIIGAITEEKGVDFIIKVFLSTSNLNYRLYVVGNGSSEFVEKCKNFAKNDNRIIFYGEEKEIEKIYAISNCIIRGEDIPRVGRTIYEGLYAGCSVLIPYSEDMIKIDDYEKFKDKIIFYSPRNITSCKEVFETNTFEKNCNIDKMTNIEEYKVKFLNYLNRLT